MTEYELISIRPKQLFLQVLYKKPGYPDFRKNFNTDNFSEENLHYIAQEGVMFAENYWRVYDAQPDEVSLTSLSGIAKEKRILDIPEYNRTTQRIKETRTETETEIIIGYEIIDKSPEEIQLDLQDWRKVMSVTMRQARLALAQQGLLSQVATAVQSLSAEEQEVFNIEWEYSTTVERSSSWVLSMAAALNLSDTDLDNLFKLAATL